MTRRLSFSGVPSRRWKGSRQVSTGQEGTDLEGVGGPGDSGGPALLELDGRVLVAGVSSAASSPPGQYGLTDESAPTPTGSGRFWRAEAATSLSQANTLWSPAGPVR